MAPTRETGWYRDPTHPDRHRFWDGRRWQSQAEHLPPEQPAEPDDPPPRLQVVAADADAERRD